jgi:hypothetical protein
MSLLRNFSPGGSEPDDDEQPPTAAQPGETAPRGGGQAPGTARYAFADPAASPVPAPAMTVSSEVITEPDEPAAEPDEPVTGTAPLAEAPDPETRSPDLEAPAAEETPAPALETLPPKASAPPKAPVPETAPVPVPTPPETSAAETAPTFTPGAGPGPDFAAPLLRDAAELRARWQRVQGDFVDDPQAAVSDAAALVGQTAEALVDALRQRERQLRATWERGAADGQAPAATAPGAMDTEHLRLMMQRYRALFNQLCRPS